MSTQTTTNITEVGVVMVPPMFFFRDPDGNSYLLVQAS
jgi:hypothetical protein